MAKTAITALIECSNKYFNYLGIMKRRDCRYTPNKQLAKGYYEWIDIFDSCFCVHCTVDGELSIRFYRVKDADAEPDFSVCYQNVDYSQAKEILEEVGKVMHDVKYWGNDPDVIQDNLARVTARY